MDNLRRKMILGALSAPIIGSTGLSFAQESKTLKISHQFPGGTIDKGDFRDRLCRKFAVEVEKRTNGALKFEVYPGSSLMKTMAQFSALRKGALDLSYYPMPYAGGEVVEANVGLMPALVTSYEQGARWKNAECGKILNKILNDKGVVILSWVWQAGGVASRATPIVVPNDLKGLKVRGGSREFDTMIKAAGGSVMTSVPSNEIYQAMQTGTIDGVYTSSASLMSFKVAELSKNFTTARNKAYWFMLEPLFISKQVFDSLPKSQRDIMMDVGTELEAFALKASKEDDIAVADQFAKSGSKLFDLDSSAIAKWQTVASESSWKEYAEKNETCAAIMKSAIKLS